MHTALTRALAAALAILALAAPTALARPGGPASPAAAHARAEAERLQGPGPVYWSYDYEAPTPQSHPAVVPHDDGTPWPAILLGATGVLMLGGAVAVDVKRARTRRAWAAA